MDLRLCKLLLTGIKGHKYVSQYYMYRSIKSVYQESLFAQSMFRIC